MKQNKIKFTRFFTSDWHLNSVRTLTYFHRPFKTLDEEHDSLINETNKLDKNAVVFHVGDFILTGVDRHGRLIDDATGRPKAEAYRAKLIPNFILLSGNHDDGHNAETDARCLLIDLSRLFRRVTVGHYPSTQNEYEGINGTNVGRKYDPSKTHIHICGHVHDSWLFAYDYKHDVLNVNVGVDVWNYKPVSDWEISNQLRTVFEIQMKNNAFNHDWIWTQHDRDMYFKGLKLQQQELKNTKREKRYAKKGLTPEECERRKQAGILENKIKKLHMISKAPIDTCREAFEKMDKDFIKAKEYLISQHQQENIDNDVVEEWSPS